MVLLALLAILRKVIILDVTKTDALTLLALSAAILSLGGTYWLLRAQDARLEGAGRASRAKASQDTPH